MQRFKRLGSVKKSYEEQGEIFFTCRRYHKQPERVKRKIRDLCRRAGGEYSAALFCFLTTGASWQGVTDEYHISAKTLDRVRTKFFDLWD